MRAITAVCVPEGITLRVFEVGFNEEGSKVWRFHACHHTFYLFTPEHMPFAQDMCRRETKVLQERTGIKHVFIDRLYEGNIADVSDIEMLVEGARHESGAGSGSLPAKAFPPNWAEPGERFGARQLIGLTSTLPLRKHQ